MYTKSRPLSLTSRHPVVQVASDVLGKPLSVPSRGDRDKMDADNTRIPSSGARAGDRSSDAPALDVDAAEEEVLDLVRIPVSRELQDAQVPVLAVARGGGADGLDGLLQVVGAGRVPEADGVGAEVDLVGDVVPDPGQELGAPPGITADHPPQEGVVGPGRAAQPPGLELGEVALEEGDLVLARLGGGVGVLPHDAEVVPDLAPVDGRGRLRDQLGPAHVLAVPERRRVQRELDALGRRPVGRVLVVRRQLHVGRRRAGPVDVPLVRPDLVRPVPLVQVGGRLEVIEPSVPEDRSTCGEVAAHEGEERRGFHGGGGGDRGSGVGGRGSILE